VVDVTAGPPSLVVLWAHPRSVSTAFVRMMMERPEVTVVHEPLVLLTDVGHVDLPGPGDDPVRATTVPEVVAALRARARRGPVFVKDTLEYPYTALFDDPALLDGAEHTFIVRDPARTIESHAAIKPDLTCANVGFEHQWRLFELVRDHTGRTPVVVDADALLADPAGVVRAWCAAVGWPFRPEALRWAPADRPEFATNRRWHLDAIASSGFAPVAKTFARTVADDPVLAAYLAHHAPFHRALAAHALAPVPEPPTPQEQP
jgi:hypothetical protein